MPTLLQYLSTVDPDLDRTNVKTGMNSFNPEWDVVEGIREWTDFTYENMITMLGDTLTSMYQSSQFDMPTQLRRPTLQIVDETTVAAVLLKWNHTIVDRALQLASSTRNLRSMSWALGAHADISGQVIFPDWAGIDLDSTFPASNRVPGDTKVSGKWNTDMQQKEEDDTDEFFKPLRQVIHYARLFNTRYAYVISDKELVCIRRTLSEYEESPLAHRRTRRNNHPPSTPTRRGGRLSQALLMSSPINQPSPSFGAETPSSRLPQSPQRFLTPQRQPRPRQGSITSTMSGMSIDTPSFMLSSPSNIKSSPSAYTDGGNPDVNEAMIEIAVIPWGENRPNHLTINLALFWIHVLASSDIDLRSSYPPLGESLDVAETETDSEP